MDWYAIKVEDLKKPACPRPSTGVVTFRIQVDPEDELFGYAELDVPRYDDCEGSLAWLRWLKEFHHLRQIKQWNTKPHATHNAIQILLSGEARDEYLALVGDTLKVTNEIMDTALFEMTRSSVFHGDDPTLSIRHLLETMVKPKHLSVTDFYLAFKELLSFMPLVARGAVKPPKVSEYTEAEVYQLFCNTLPDRWTGEFKRTGRRPTVKHLLQFCQVVEGTEIRKKGSKSKF